MPNRSRTRRPRVAAHRGGTAPVGDPHARVHVAAVGFEVERVVEPLLTERADRVYLLTRRTEDAARPFLEEVLRRLERAPWPVEVRVVRTEIWDVFGALAELRAIFTAERRVDRNAGDVLPIRVNVSTGTKITAIAGTLACMLWKGEPYYVQVSQSWYSRRTPRVQPVNDVVRRIEPVAVYELRSPSRELVEVLEALERHGGRLRKRELIRELGLDRPGEGASGPPSPQAQHSRLRNRLEPLEHRWRFIAAEPTGARGRVAITEQGRLALTLFGESGRGVRPAAAE
ncbi:MAG: DUF6293 family protein [Thermoplasmata archaeon]|nr:DUF6293 family protein [Thermoplasmata archaeon]MCI4340857.1 DUF6293 family protein [Thermoplasmata archaeon]